MNDADGQVIRVTCPHCGAGIRVKPKAVGRQVRCPGPACGRSFTVTGPAERGAHVPAADVPAADAASADAVSAGAAMDLSRVAVPRAAREAVPVAIAREYAVLPLSRDGDTIRLAVADVTDTGRLQKLEFILNLKVQPVAARREQIPAAIERCYTAAPAAAENTPPPRDDSDYLAAGSLEEFASLACRSPAQLATRMAEIGVLIPMLRDAMMRTHRGISADEALGRVTDRLSVSCPRCGILAEHAVAILALAGGGLLRTAVFGGPDAAALGRGRCPGCGGDAARVRFEP